MLVPPERARKPAGRFRFRARHAVAVLIFLALVPIPIGATSWYLFTRAQDQFSSTFGFVVHSEGEDIASGLPSGLSGLAAFGVARSPDSEVLNAYLTSQALVAQVNEEVDLRSLWAKHHDIDPLFSFSPDGSIEDLTRFWQRMVRVSYESGPGLIDIEIKSFDAASAQHIAQAVERASSDLINRIGSIARDDRLRYSETELAHAEHRLTSARQALTEFRVRHRMIDPTSDLEGEMGVLFQLQNALAEELVALDLLRQNTGAPRATARNEAISNSRIVQGERRIDAIRNQINAAREDIGHAGRDQDLARLMGQFEALIVAVEIAQEAYAYALSAREANRAAMDRKTRYLAAYSPPTLAERAIYPRRWTILGSVAIGAILLWSISFLILLGLRDRM